MSCVVLAAGAARASCPVSRARAAGMRRSPAALLALALLLSATAAAAAQANKTNCTLLADKSADRLKEVGWRVISERNRIMNLTLMWGSEPARAAAALLSVLLRHVRLYRDVYLDREPSPLATAALATHVRFQMSHSYNELIIALSTAWEPKAPPPPWRPRKGMFPGLAGPRLAEFGASPVPARRRLFAWLAPRVRSHCRSHERWSFYNDRSALAKCGFVEADSLQAPTVDVKVVGDCSDCNDTLKRLAERANATRTQLILQTVDRAQFLRTLDTASRSFLFLDWDMWQGADGVSVIEPPPCMSVDIHCTQEFNSTIAMRVADVDMIMTHAAQLFYFVYNFNPSLKTLRQIIDRQASGVDIEEAACEWALKNKSYVMIPEYDFDYYNMVTYVCDGDPDISFYNRIAQNVVKETASAAMWTLVLYTMSCNCSDKNDLSKRIHNWKSTAGYFRILGIVSLSVESVAVASHAAMDSSMPLMLADVAPERGSGEANTWRVAGRPRHLALALLRFMRESHWKRLAVVSQNTTELAADYYGALTDQRDISLREFSIPLYLEEQETQKVLRDLRDTKARIVFINADFQAAVTILRAATAAGMGYVDGFVWIVRDWRESNTVCETKHFMVSFWSRDVDDLPASQEWVPLREQLRDLRPKQPWPPRAVALADALLTLTMGLKEVFRRYPEMRQDLRREKLFQ